MNRRGFLRSLGLVAITPSVVPAVAEKCASITRWWIPTQWWEKEFDYGIKVGFAAEYKNVLTGELARHAVLLNKRLNNVPGEYVYGRNVAKTILNAWAEDLPPVIGRAPSKPYSGCVGRRYDDVLEGNEIQA